MCKQNVKNINHVLLDCELARDLWVVIFSTFEIELVMPHRTVELLDCWWNPCWSSKNLDIWRTVPMSFIWQKRNAQTFEQHEMTVTELKAKVFNILYAWMAGLNFRHTLYPAYKSNRPPTPDTIVQGLQYLKASIKAMSIKVIEVPGVEADDVIGTLAARSVDAGYKVRVVSPDKDFFQILSPSLRLLRIAPRGIEMVSFGVEDFAEKYGALKPSQFVDVISLMGDKSDNIPGYFVILFVKLISEQPFYLVT
ncbi:hypothetical protein F2P56_015755 [Juglans regia]|uniref:5'-3' exonuclease domain-containing protein n=1 Tax=Juglans regia TaxID=51240 RepID=A0A833XG83_JUGRE|nr:hypothetical protein F2P56_015755 [Juglans regia]